MHFLSCLTSHWHVPSVLRFPSPLRLTLSRSLHRCSAEDRDHKGVARATTGFHASDLYWTRNRSGTCSGCDGSSRASSMKDNTLYFGHRASGKDEHYAREWISLAEGTPRVYVQDLIRQDAKRIWQLVYEKDAWVYISGCVHPLGPACARMLTSDRSLNKCWQACGLRW